MGAATGRLDVITPQGTTTYEWNGVVEDKEAARAAFDSARLKGMSLAVVIDSPGTAHQVRTFDEVLEVEKERGEVTVQISPAIVGG